MKLTEQIKAKSEVFYCKKCNQITFDLQAYI